MDVRMFVSVKVPDISGLMPLISDLRGIRGVRVPDTRQMHLTLCFIGDVDERKIDVIEGCVKASVKGIPPGRITLKSVGVFPERGAPKVIWTGVDSDIPLGNIARSISSGLDRTGIDHDTKPFKPHMTIGRVQGTPDVREIMSKYRDTVFCSFDCISIEVMKSELSPQGARHSVLRRINLE